MNNQNSSSSQRCPPTHEEIVEQVAERVMQLWREDSKREKERVGPRHKSNRHKKGK